MRLNVSSNEKDSSQNGMVRLITAVALPGAACMTAVARMATDGRIDFNLSRYLPMKATEAQSLHTTRPAAKAT